MTAYRLHVGPVPSALGELHEVLQIRQDGHVVRAVAETMASAQAQLEAEPEAQEPWCGAETLGGMVGGPSSSEQVGSATRHLVSLLDPGSKLDCSHDGILHSLIASMAALTLRGPGLVPGTSRPYRFEVEGVYEGSGHTILSASPRGFSCISMSSIDDVRRVYEAAGSPASSDGSVNLIGVTSRSEPDWALAAFQALSGQPFVPEFFVRLGPTAVPFGPKSALMTALLLAAWPVDPAAAQTERSLVTLPVGRARVTLSPVAP